MVPEPNIMTLLINLAESGERLAASCTTLKAAGLDPERFDAVDGRALVVRDVDGYDAHHVARVIGRDMRPGEIGCFLSHRQALEHFLASDATALMLCEDDIDSDPDVAALLSETLEWLSRRAPNWRAVHLSSDYDKYSRSICRLGDRRLKRAYAFPLTTTGILWSRTGAKAALAALDTIKAPVDNAFRLHLSGTAEAYQIVPRPMRARDVPSDIDRIDDRVAKGSGGTKHGDRWRVYRLVIESALRDLFGQRAR